MKRTSRFSEKEKAGMVGRVRNFEPGGYGFIASHPRTRDFFFRAASVIGEVQTGNIVNFWLDDDPHKPGQLMAVEVTARERDPEPRVHPDAGTFGRTVQLG
jgi:cold shock CspA family protein